MMFALTVMMLFFLTPPENKGLVSANFSLQHFRNQYNKYFTIHHNNVLRALNAMLDVILNWWIVWDPKVCVDSIIIIVTIINNIYMYNKQNASDILWRKLERQNCVSIATSSEPLNHSSGKDSESNRFVTCKITFYVIVATNPKNRLTLKTDLLTY